MPTLRRRPGPHAGPAASRSAGLPGRAGGAVSLAAAALAVFAAAAAGGPAPASRAGGGVPAQARVAWTAWECRRVPLPPPPGGPAPEPPASQPEHPEPAEPDRPVEGSPDPGDGPDAPAAELRVLANAERRGMGLRALAADPLLDQLAARKAAEMVRLGYFGHQSPNYGSPFDMLAQAGVHFRSAAENLARAGDPAAAHAALMGSAGHRGNLLSRSFTHLGVGAAPGPDGIVFVQLFIER